MKNLGVIGCGGRIRAVLKLLLDKSADIQVTALCDPSEKSCRKTSQMVKNKPVIYEDYQQLVCDKNVDWVVVGSWNCFHKEQVIAAFNAGKHVFCEKPLATTFDDCLEIKRVWEKSHLNCVIGFTLRFSPHYRKIKEILDQRIIGDIISLEFNETLPFMHGGLIHCDWRRFTKNAGTHLLEKCCHDIDIVNWITRSLPSKVASFGGLDFFVPKNYHHVQRLGRNENGQQAYCLGDIDPFNAEMDIIDNQVAILEYYNGARATFHTNCNSGIPERRLYICGTEGALRSDVISGKIEVQRTGFNENTVDCSTEASGSHGDGDEVLARELAASILNNAPPTATLDDGYNAAIACFAVDDAMKHSQVIDLADYWKRAGISCRRESK